MDNWDSLFKSAVEQSFNAVLITNASFEQGGPHIVYVNQAFCTMTRYDESELIGRSPRILQGEFTDPKVIAELRHCLKHHLYFHGSTVNYRKDGAPYFVEWSISPVRNAAGQVTHYVSVQQNISEHMRAEQERDLLAKTLNSASDPVLITDNTARIVFANQAFERGTGITAEALIGKTPVEIQPQHKTDAFQDFLDAALRQGTPFRALFSNRRKKGELFFAAESDAFLQNSKEQMTRHISIGSEITDLLQRERLLQEMALIDKSNTSNESSRG